MKNREVLRTCVVCRKQFNKRDLIRIVRVNDNELVVDKTGKMNGRGAYISINDGCIDNKGLKFKLQNALKVKIEDEEFDKLLVDIKEGAKRE